MKTAPDFTLKNTSNEDVSLSDFKGEKNVVLLFFPLAFSGVCTKELCSTRDNLKIYNSLDAEVLAISIDSFFTLKAFKEANNLNFSLLSDFNKEVSAKYDSLYDDYFGMKGVSKRSVFVIDKEGRVVHQEILEDSGKIPNLSKVQEVLAGLN
ncbi:redoxin domain-containing protein [Gracilimonas sediminicola]|uniref:Redoxin domain-containing protein n=1 Tax=Gracilimonas sediminicola TaxID=2952158 RepID=A0A9X2L5Q4_9BACT|nr:redoxin domain-containing protein [Gracilimonas sediminicola]MCP9292745.1 redoxin domain-containing protein [Gracilimonas sediminicola]